MINILKFITIYLKKLERNDIIMNSTKKFAKYAATQIIQIGKI